MDTKDDQPQPRGFRALSSMASDIGPLDSGADAGDPSGQGVSQEESNAQAHRRVAAPASRGRSDGFPLTGWIVALGLLSLLAWAGMQSSNTQGSSPSSGPPAASGTPPSEPPPTPVPEATTEPPSNLSGSGSGEPASGALEEVRPPVGTDHVLNVAQIRYCLAQSLRIDGADPEVDTSRELEIDLFNEWVDDYNSRCSDFRYYDGTLERARRDIQPHRDRLLAEGRSRFLALVRRQSLGRGLYPRETREPTRLNGGSGPSPARVGSSLGTAGRSTESGGKPDLSGLTESERQGVERACNHDRQFSGPAAYYGCLASQLRSLSRYDGRPDLSLVSGAERASIERACNYDRQFSGPAAYYGCLASQLRSLSRYTGKPDLSGVSDAERASIERACNYDRQFSGAAAYYGCLASELRSLSRYEGKPDLSVVSEAEREAIERACNYDRQFSGPAAYYGCLRTELRRLGHGGS